MKNILNKLGILFLASVLTVATIPLAGCSSSQFIADLNLISPAVLNVLEIVALFQGSQVDQTIPAKINADVAAITKLYTDFQAASGANKGNIQKEITAEFAVLNSDLSSVFTLAHVSNPNTQSKITALLGLIETSVTLAEDFITPPATTATNSYKLTDNQLIDSYNKVLVARTGIKPVDDYTAKHEIHKHNFLVRHMTFGMAH